MYLLDWENKYFPEFDFVDLEENQLTSENTKDKTIYFKTYFVACQACAKEIPILDKLVAQHAEYEQVMFLSFATDDPEKLNKFL